MQLTINGFNYASEACHRINEITTSNRNYNSKTVFSEIPPVCHHNIGETFYAIDHGAEIMPLNFSRILVFFPLS
jgi:hypothetical protein